MSPNPFIKIFLRPQFGVGHSLQWEIDPLFSDPEPHNFVIEASGAMDFSELLREIQVGNVFFGTDPIRQQNTETAIYYRVRLETPEGKYYSKGINPNYTPSTRHQFSIAAEIVRKEHLRMSKYTGAPIVILKRKIYGKQVTDDTVDPITGLPITDSSPHQGNMFVSGYYAPVKSFMSIESGNDVFAMDPGGTGAIANTRLEVRMLGFPYVNYNDIIIDFDADLRYIVKDRDEVNFPGTSIVLLQTLQLSLIPPSDPVYSININSDE